MRLDWIVPARYAEVATDGTMTIVGAGVDALYTAAGLPVSARLFLALRAAAPEDEWREDGHSIEITLLDPSGAECSRRRIELRRDTMPRFKSKGAEAGLLLAFAERWTASRFGLYIFDIHLDDRQQRSIGVAVRQN
jgi:hypothetical protein